MDRCSIAVEMLSKTTIIWAAADKDKEYLDKMIKVAFEVADAVIAFNSKEK